MADTDQPRFPLGSALIILMVMLMTLALTACASAPKVVERPVPVPCRVSLPADRLFPFDQLVAGADIFTQVKTLLADREERIADRRETRAAAEVCS